MSPLDLDPLNVENEKRRVEEAIKFQRAQGLVELVWLDGQTWRDLQRTMRHSVWHVFHFIGHGGFDPDNDEGAIALADEKGYKRLLRGHVLARLLDDHNTLRLVFLNSCEGARSSQREAFSSIAATLVRREIPAVVAMQYEITDGSAIEFARSFYESVADGLPVEAAVAEARKAVSMESMLEWGTPVLNMRSTDGRIFDISTSTLLVNSTQETQGQQDLADQYREYVELVWTDEELDKREAEWLKEFANNRLKLNPSTAADIEREVMGGTIEAVLERQKQATHERYRKAPAKHYEAVVVGAGQAGVPLAVTLANAGRKTALIEREHVGGTCINEGCVPSTDLCVKV